MGFVLVNNYWTYFKDFFCVFTDENPLLWQSTTISTWLSQMCEHLLADLKKLACTRSKKKITNFHLTVNKLNSCKPYCIHGGCSNKSKYLILHKTWFSVPKNKNVQRYIMKTFRMMYGTTHPVNGLQGFGGTRVMFWRITVSHKFCDNSLIHRSISTFNVWLVLGLLA